MQSVFKRIKLPNHRGLSDINTVKKKRGQPRSLSEMFNELAQLEREKARLITERENWERRIESIDTRLAKMAEKVKPLQQALAKETQAFTEEALFEQVVEDSSRRNKNQEEEEGPSELIIQY